MLNDVRLSSRACFSYAKLCTAQFTGLPFMYDSVHGPAFPMLNHVWLGSWACISYAKSCMTQFTGLDLALIKMWLSSRAYISFAKSCLTQFTGLYVNVTQFTGLLFLCYIMYFMTQFTGLDLALIKMWLSSRAYISYAKSCTIQLMGLYSIVIQFTGLLFLCLIM